MRKNLHWMYLAAWKKIESPNYLKGLKVLVVETIGKRISRTKKPPKCPRILSKHY